MPWLGKAPHCHLSVLDFVHRSATTHTTAPGWSSEDRASGVSNGSSEAEMKQTNNWDGVGCSLFLMLFWAVVGVGLVYIAAHFIVKYW